RQHLANSPASSSQRSLVDVTSAASATSLTNWQRVLATPTLLSIFVVVPAASHYLGPKASVVKAPDFESGLVKVLCGKEKKLTQAKQRALSRLRRAEAHPTNRSSTAKLSFTDRLLQSDSKTASRFIDLR
ncbi:hypothetical protein JG688_00011902, partial [Phytophthora aleatoria]